MIKRLKSTVINDGKVVMVKLMVKETSTGFIFNTVGRATCDLTEDTFDLDFGIKLAEERAYQKAIKECLKAHKEMLRFNLKEVEREKREIEGLLRKLK